MKIFASIFEVLPLAVRVLCWNIVNQECLCFAYDNEEKLFIVMSIKDEKFTYMFAKKCYERVYEYYTTHSIAPQLTERRWKE